MRVRTANVRNMGLMEQGSLVQQTIDPDLATPVPQATGCPVAHKPPPAAVCPVKHQPVAEPAGVCPFPRSTGVVQRSRADMVVRKVLRIHERPEGASSKDAYAAFQKSMMISGLRCTLTYVIFPFVIPVLGLAAGVGPLIGIVIGVVAMTCDVFTVRRFFAIDHKYRWYFSAVAVSVTGLLTVLLVQDVMHLVG